MQGNERYVWNKISTQIMLAAIIIRTTGILGRTRALALRKPVQITTNNYNINKDNSHDYYTF